MNNPTSTENFSHIVHDELVGGFLSYPEPDQEEGFKEEEQPDDQEEKDGGGN